MGLLSLVAYGKSDIYISGGRKSVNQNVSVIAATHVRFGGKSKYHLKNVKKMSSVVCRKILHITDIVQER